MGKIYLGDILPKAQYIQSFLQYMSTLNLNTHAIKYFRWLHLSFWVYITSANGQSIWWTGVNTSALARNVVAILCSVPYEMMKCKIIFCFLVFCKLERMSCFTVPEEAGETKEKKKKRKQSDWSSWSLPLGVWIKNKWKYCISVWNRKKVGWINRQTTQSQRCKIKLWASLCDMQLSIGPHCSQMRVNWLLLWENLTATHRSS